MSEMTTVFRKSNNHENWEDSYAKLGKLSSKRKTTMQVNFTSEASMFAIAEETMNVSNFFSFDDDVNEQFLIYGINPMKKTEHKCNMSDFEESLLTEPQK